AFLSPPPNPIILPWFDLDIHFKVEFCPTAIVSRVTVNMDGQQESMSINSHKAKLTLCSSHWSETSN
ncbi:hypothetical protein STEG23_007113, partial [Scotinomys teguina]